MAASSPVAAYLIETSVTLLGVIVVAGVLLYGARRRGLGRSAGPLDLIGRLPLDGQRAVYLVRIGSTVYVIGGSEAGLAKIGEMSEADLGPLPEPAKGALAAMIRRAIGGSPVDDEPTTKGAENEHAE